MELARILRALWARKLLTGLTVVLAIAAAAGVKLSKHSVPTGTATAQILVDSPDSTIADLRQDPTPLTARASVIAQLMASALIQQEIATAAGVPVHELTTQGPFSGPGLALDQVTPSEARGPQLQAQKILYRLTFVAQQQLPLITIAAQAPTPDKAQKLAAAVYPAVNGYVQSLQSPSTSTSATGTTPTRDRVTLRQLGPVLVGTENSGSALAFAVVAFLAVLILGFLVLVALESLRPLAKAAAADTGEQVVEISPELALSRAMSAVRSAIARENPESIETNADDAADPDPAPADKLKRAQRASVGS